jgi:hypothetical protein
MIEIIISDRNELWVIELYDEVPNPTASPMQHYLNIINNSQDPDNSEYNNLLGKMKSVEEQIHITNIFDYEEDNN